MLEHPQIYRMTDEDIVEVLEIQADLSFQNWSQESFLSEIRNIDYSVPLVAKNGRIWGYMVVRILADEAELCSIAVSREKMGMGVAQAMWRSADHILHQRQIKSMFLEVRVSNSRAIAFYRKNRFQDQGVRKSYYADGEDALIMVRSIDFDV